MQTTTERRCVRDMIADIRNSLDVMETNLNCGMSPEKFGLLAIEAQKAIELVELCRQRFVEKSQAG
jgi:hypothetical protein